MTKKELKTIAEKHNAAIIAPAGHGKTEMITELVDKLKGKKLVLTHTNAGVSALSKRMIKRGVNKDKYYLSTISSFCMKWCSAYPRSAEIDESIGITDQGYYEEQHRGAFKIFRHEWARAVLEETYSCVIVDEYQDCVIGQHRIFKVINRTLPVYVLGDPLQSIFGWAGELVSWSNIGFERVEVKTLPHRWEKTCIELGLYLESIRDALMPALDGNSVRMPITTNDEFLFRVSTDEGRRIAYRKDLRQYSTILYLTKWPNAQCVFSQRSGGIFQNDEPQNFRDLYKFAQELDADDGYTRCETIYRFISECATQVNAELGSYEKHIKEGDFDFDRIRKHHGFGDRVLRLYKNHGYEELLSVLEWIRENSIFHLYRRELFTEMMRSIRFARDRGTTIYEASQQIRMIPNNQSRYSEFKCLSSRTVLSKGLEFDCVIINLEERFTATEMYVAMTRAMKAIYFITNEDYVVLDVPQGIK